MANNLSIRDGLDVVRSVKTTDNNGTHTPHIKAEGPLTNAELRAQSLTVTGAFLTDTQLRASALPVTGPLTNSQLRASSVPVSGPVTDAQLRNSPVPVTGPLTAAQLLGLEIQTKGVPEEAWMSGTFVVCPELDVVPITIPEGALGVRICPRDASVKYALDSLPDNAPLNTLANGGISKPDVWKEVLFTGVEQTLYLLSLIDEDQVPSDSSPASTGLCLVDVEFFGADAASSSSV